MALFRGRVRAGAMASYNGTIPGAAGYFTAMGLKDSGDAHTNVDVMQGVAADGAAREGAALAVAQSDDRSWWAKFLAWFGL